MAGVYRAALWRRELPGFSRFAETCDYSTGLSELSVPGMLDNVVSCRLKEYSGAQDVYTSDELWLGFRAIVNTISARGRPAPHMAIAIRLESLILSRQIQCGFLMCHSLRWLIDHWGLIMTYDEVLTERTMLAASGYQSKGQARRIPLCFTYMEYD